VPDRISSALYACVAGEGVVKWDWSAGVQDLVIATEDNFTGGALSPSGRHLLLASDASFRLVNLEVGIPAVAGSVIESRADRFGFVAGQDLVFLQQGSWLRAYDIANGELAPSAVRLLAAVPGALAALPRAEFIWLGAANAGSPRSGVVNLFEAAGPPLEGRAGDLLATWQERMQLQIDVTGQAVSRRGE
jgi:hypothetical protein